MTGGKQTKIICTISNKHCEPDFLRELVEAGMNVVRLNTAHMEPADADGIVANLRAVSDRVAIMIDTKGPEVRTCDLPEPLVVRTGEVVRVSSVATPKRGFRVNYENFVEEVPVGRPLLVDDGETKLTVVEKESDALVCRVDNDGEVKDRKSVNTPGVRLDMPALTEKDAAFIEWGAKAGIDFVAHSFVRRRDDVMAVQTILDLHKSPIKIVAKIENREGVDHLEEILDVAYGVMVARGDLGIEIPAEEVPVIQKQIIRICNRRVKPVITATQMLHSMIESPRPTRAEVSDVANAIYDGTDAVMLSGETAYGKYPVEAVRTMADIARNVEAHKHSLGFKLPVFHQEEDLMPRNHLAKSAVAIASSLHAKAIITSTKSGETARVCAAYRGKTPVFALSANAHVIRQLALSYGIHAERIQVPHTTEELVEVVLETLFDKGVFGKDDLVVFIGGGHVYEASTNFLLVDTPSTLLKRVHDEL